MPNLVIPHSTPQYHRHVWLRTNEMVGTPVEQII